MKLPYLMWRSSSMTNIFFLLLVAMNFPVNQTSATNRFKNETDRSALLEFKHQVSDPLGVLSSWNNSLHHCQWLGVTCDTRHQRVIALNLSRKSLSGTISPHVGNLSFMKFIHLGENQFHGEIPQEVGRLFRLRLLNLSSNILTGEIPINLSYCSELKHLNLSKNGLQGIIPTEIGSFKKLEFISLFENNLTGEIPSSIGNLTSLKLLALPYNKLKGKLPNEMGFLTSLYFLRLTENKLSGMIPASIYNISTIEFISTTKNFFHGSLPASIGLSLPNLRVLSMWGNRFNGNIPNSITNSSMLEVLEVAENNFDGHVPTNLGDLPNLQRLNLGRNFFGSNSTGDLGFIASLTNNSNLRSIDLEANNFGGEIPKVMANLSCHQLTKIYIGGNQLSGTIPQGLGNLVNLCAFDASSNSLSGVIPTDFGKLQNLQFLGLQGNRLSGEILSSLCNSTILFHLDLTDNQFEGSHIFDNALKNCHNLQELYISQNKFSGVISPHLFDTHSSLVYLSLGQNAFSGSIPLEAGKLMHLGLFNVSYNKFSGEIPTTLGDCPGLEYLLMQGNYFQGIIPQNLASLKSIQQLDLSSNNLTGQLPKDLEKLQFLTYLNLSNNDLEGEIPTTGIFGNASQISLIGNNKLCGGIPELNFSSCVMVGQSKGKPVVIIVLSTVLPAAVLVLGILAIYFLMYQKRYRRKAGSSSMPTTVNEFLRLSYHDLHCATSGFSPENLIGSGSFGVVYKGRLDHHGNRLVAVKVLDLQKNGASKSFKAECKAIRNIRHRNLISIVSYCSSFDSSGHEFKALVYQFIENGDLDLWLHPETIDQATRLTNLNFFKRLNIAIDVASALHYLHKHCETTIVHCDLKPSNILLDNDLVAYVGDFGLTRLLQKTVSTSSEQTSSTITIKGSIGYAAPEYGMGHAASTQGDVYSYGILLLEMITSKRPTDDMFMDGLDLHSYVNMALPEQIFKIVDPMLLATGDENEEMAGEQQTVNSERKMECIIALLKIGLKCSATLPNDRMHMNEVIRKLHLIKDAFLGFRVLTDDLSV